MRKKRLIKVFALALSLTISVSSVAPVQAATPGQARSATEVTYGKVTAADSSLIRTLFDVNYYAANNPDATAAYGNDEEKLYNHFITSGIFEGRACNKDFNVSAYRSSYADLDKEFKGDIVSYYMHYLRHGMAEKRALTTIDKAVAAGKTVRSAVNPSNIVAEPAPAPAPAPAPTPAPAPDQSNKDKGAEEAAKAAEEALKAAEEAAKAAEEAAKKAEEEAYRKAAEEAQKENEAEEKRKNEQEAAERIVKIIKDNQNAEMAYETTVNIKGISYYDIYVAETEAMKYFDAYRADLESALELCNGYEKLGNIKNYIQNELRCLPSSGPKSSNKSDLSTWLSGVQEWVRANGETLLYIETFISQNEKKTNEDPKEKAAYTHELFYAVIKDIKDSPYYDAAFNAIFQSGVTDVSELNTAIKNAQPYYDAFRSDLNKALELCGDYAELQEIKNDIKYVIDLVPAYAVKINNKQDLNSLVDQGKALTYAYGTLKLAISIYEGKIK